MPSVEGVTKKDLKGLASIWKKQYAGKKTNWGAEVPSGEYKLKLQKIGLGRTQKGEIKVALTWVVMSGKFAKKKVFENENIARAADVEGNGIRFFMRKLATMGVDIPESHEELIDLLAELNDNKVEVLGTVVENGGFTNVRVKGLLSELGLDDSDDDAGEEEDEDEDEEEEETKPKKKKKPANEDEDEEEEEDVPDDDDLPEEEEEEEPRKGKAKKKKEDPDEESEEETDDEESEEDDTPPKTKKKKPSRK